MPVKFEYTGKLSDGRYFDTDSTKKVTIELDDNDLNVNEMLEEFMNFMKAIGYHFELGDHLEVVNDFKNNKDELKLDFSKYDLSAEMNSTNEQVKFDIPKIDDIKFNLSHYHGNVGFYEVSQTGMDGTSDPAYGAVPP
jgi:hypothetical protein